MNILKSVKKIPGGLMVVPLLLGAILIHFLAVRSGPCLMVHLLHTFGNQVQCRSWQCSFSVMQQLSLQKNAGVNRL